MPVTGIFKFQPCEAAAGGYDSCCGCVLFEDNFEHDEREDLNPDEDAPWWTVDSGDWQFGDGGPNWPPGSTKTLELTSASGRLFAGRKRLIGAERSYNVAIDCHLTEPGQIYRLYFAWDRDAGSGYYFELEVAEWPDAGDCRVYGPEGLIESWTASWLNAGGAIDQEHWITPTVCVFEEVSEAELPDDERYKTIVTRVWHTEYGPAGLDYHWIAKYTAEQFPGDKCGIGFGAERGAGAENPVFDNVIISDRVREDCDDCPGCIYCLYSEVSCYQLTFDWGPNPDCGHPTQNVFYVTGLDHSSCATCRNGMSYSRACISVYTSPSYNDRVDEENWEGDYILRVTLFKWWPWPGDPDYDFVFELNLGGDKPDCTLFDCDVPLVESLDPDCVGSITCHVTALPLPCPA